jgi:glycosyltransferase involved in cell wall biosynthesis
MASGIPVIATKSGTLDMIKNNQTGIVVNRNSKSIYNAVEKLINSPEKRQYLAVNARKHIEQFDWHVLAEKIEKWYLEKENVLIC